jgi:glycosyltransferase involved in cell wall biosynthesis
MATLTVLLCNYNHAKHLPKAIEAIMSQSRLPDAFYLLDDGSTDNSMEVINGYVSKYPLIRLFKNPQNLGLMKSFARVLGEAQTDFIYPASADDFILPGFFEKAMALGDKYPKAGVVIGKVVTKIGPRMPVVDEISTHKEAGFLPAGEWLAHFHANPFSAPSPATLFNREAFIKIGGFRAEMGPMADFFALRALTLRHGGCYVPEPVAVFVPQPASYSNTVINDPEKRLKVIEALIGTMKSAEFAELFPEYYMDRFEFLLRETWRKGYGPDSGRIVVGYNLPDVRQAYLSLANWGAPESMIVSLFVRAVVRVARVLGLTN